MRVLFLSMDDPFVAATGPGAHLRGLSQSLSILGSEVHILVLSSKNSNRVENGVQVHSVRVRLGSFNITGVKDLLFCQMSRTLFEEIDLLCRENKIDIVHGQSPASYGYAFVRRKDTPLVVTVHGGPFDELLSFLNMPPSFINPDFVIGAMLEVLSVFQSYPQLKRADKFIAVSKATAEETMRFYRLPRERVVAIHNGVDLSSFTDLRPEKESGEHTMLSVGRLSWRKGYKYLIEALPSVLTEYPDAKLFLVGDGNQRMPLQRHVKKLGIENCVRFLGNVSAEKLHSLYHEAEVYVQPSLYEPFGITILEAMSMRKPVIATCVGGIPEIITNEVEGLLVEPKNSVQLANTIINVFSDSSRRNRFGSNARKRVERDFTWEVIAKKTLSFYTNLLNDR